MTLYLTYVVKPSGKRGDDDRRPVGIFSLFHKSTEGDQVVIRFPCQDREENKQQMLRHIETYCHERGIEIANAAQWSIGD
jgi:hypothetical protein